MSSRFVFAVSLSFLILHGLSLPSARRRVYPHSTHTPLVLRWLGKIKAGVSDKALLSSMDILPTLLKITGQRPARNDQPRQRPAARRASQRYAADASDHSITHSFFVNSIYYLL